MTQVGTKDRFLNKDFPNCGNNSLFAVITMQLQLILSSSGQISLI